MPSSPPTTPNKPRSRNDIFSVSHVVSKPALLMTKEEFEELKRGEIGGVSGYTRTLPSNKDHEKRDRQKEKGWDGYVDADFRNQNTSTTRGFVDLDSPDSPTTIQEPSSPPSSSAHSVTTPRTAAPTSRKKPPPVITSLPSTHDPESFHLSFLPTSKNLLGEGRWGCVYRGWYMKKKNQSTKGSLLPPTLISDKSTNTHGWFPCAIKRLHPSVTAQSIGVSEIKLLRKLDHENLIKLIGAKDESGLSNPDVYRELSQRASCLSPDTEIDQIRQLHCDPTPRLLVVLEYAPLGDLWSYAMRNRQNVTRQRCVDWGKQLARAVEYTHEMGVVHHDIKPHNILVFDEGRTLKLGDFGNACFTRLEEEDEEWWNASESQADQVVDSAVADLFPNVLSPTISSAESGQEIPGTQDMRPPPKSGQVILVNGLHRTTPPFSAPELFNTNQPYTPSVDVYSLGCTLFALITLTPPFSNTRQGVMMNIMIQRGFWSGQAGFDEFGDYERGELKYPNGQKVGGEWEAVKGCVETVGKRWTVEKVRTVLEGCGA
ncbi:hypothetical protein HDU85_000610 [Gaertneriomyces sp. JEL0708]|nr:hypothetical protein HDU85_000610 [Gaertneriomyces sp. JEL0708]